MCLFLKKLKNLILLPFFVFAVHAQVDLTSPTGGECYNAGDTIWIQWTAANLYLDMVKIKVSLDGGIDYISYIDEGLGSYDEGWGNYPVATEQDWSTDQVRVWVEEYEGDGSNDAYSNLLSVVPDCSAHSVMPRSSFQHKGISWTQNSSSISFTFPSQGTYKAVLTQIQGKTIAIKTIQNTSDRKCTFATPSSGMYLVKITAESNLQHTIPVFVTR